MIEFCDPLRGRINNNNNIISFLFANIRIIYYICK
nr:MAG TPA: hypothetical protein [Caudoviricetes sp.]